MKKQRRCAGCTHYEQQSCSWLPEENISKAWEYEVPPYAEPYWIGCVQWKAKPRRRK